MSENTIKPTMKYLSRLALLSLMLLALFFTVSVAVFTVRTGDTEIATMPDLRGKYYTEVHNDLARYRLNVHIKSKRFPDQPPGIILSQSIAPGSVVRTKDKLTVTVNQGAPVITMPDVTGNTAESVKITLSRIPVEEEVYEMQLGGITYVPSESAVPGTVVAQFPLPGDKVIIHEKVFLLVATEAESEHAVRTEELIGKNITVVSEYFRRIKADYRIRKLEHPADYRENGQVIRIEKDAEGIYQVDAWYRENQSNALNSYETVTIEMEKAGVCEVEERRFPGRDSLITDEEKGYISRIIFSAGKAKEGEDVTLLFFRTGDVQLAASCSGEEFYTKRFRI